MPRDFSGATLRVRVPALRTDNHIAQWCDLILSVETINQLQCAEEVFQAHPSILSVDIRAANVAWDGEDTMPVSGTHCFLTSDGHVTAKGWAYQSDEALSSIEIRLVVLSELVRHRRLPDCGLLAHIDSNVACLASTRDELDELVACLARSSTSPNGLSVPELAAVLAGLRLLQIDLSSDAPCVGNELNELYTVGGKHAGLTTDQIENLCERLQVGAGLLPTHPAAA
jgi:hypothetical protein